LAVTLTELPAIDMLLLAVFHVLAAGPLFDPGVSKNPSPLLAL
jgi:hypothetical protein